MDQHWDDLVKHFCAVSDRLGMPIDDEIFDTVIALNALGITTTASCAGHITRDEGDIRYPWVDFSASDPEIEELKREQQELHEKAEKLQRKLTRLRKKNADGERIQPLMTKSRTAWHEYHSLGRKLRKLQVPMRRKAVEYLTQFYEHRSVPFDCRLTLNIIASHTRLESQGAADFYLTEPREVQLQKLAEYRDEMRAFTEFLKTIYLSQRAEETTVN
jgi:predicted RNase H-like nuclease (RuvC/YqgF family)